MAASERPDAAHGSGEWKPHILAAAQRRLRENPYLALKSVSCAYHRGVLTLRGSVPSYYLKQRAQAAVAQVEGIEQIENQIEVMPPAINLPAAPTSAEMAPE